MGMSYTRIEVSRDMVRSELQAYLEEHLRNLLLPEPDERAIDTAHEWFGRTQRAGMSVDAMASQVLVRLRSSGKAEYTEVSVNDSIVMNAHNAHQPLRAKVLIVEGIAELIRMGVLVPLRFKPERPGQNYNFALELGGDSVMVTEHGVRYLADPWTIPYYAEDYLRQLRQAAEPDEELVGYLSEGLACLRHHLPRAAAMILRLAAEHSLDKLIEATSAVLSEGKQRQAFERRVRTAERSLEKRAEVVFRKLESSSALTPDAGQLRKAVGTRLRPAFHSIRDLGGRAAHTSGTITIEDVRDHYLLYAHSVFGIMMRVIQHHKSAQESSEPNQELS